MLLTDFFCYLVPIREKRELLQYYGSSLALLLRAYLQLNNKLVLPNEAKTHRKNKYNQATKACDGEIRVAGDTRPKVKK